MLPDFLFIGKVIIHNITIQIFYLKYDNNMIFKFNLYYFQFENYDLIKSNTVIIKCPQLKI